MKNFYEKLRDAENFLGIKTILITDIGELDFLNY